MFQCHGQNDKKTKTIRHPIKLFYLMSTACVCTTVRPVSACLTKT